LSTNNSARTVDRDDETPVEEPVAALAGGFRDERAGVAGRAVQEVGGRLLQLFGAVRI
jgi:hypothetical protein